MSVPELLVVLALTGWALVKQTRVSEVVDGPRRFTLAAVYAIVGVAAGGFAAPQGGAGLGLLLLGLVLSLVVGLVRGRRTRMWAAGDGRVLRQGTALTVTLFVGLVVLKFGIGALAASVGVDDGAGLGEIVVSIAVMVAVQAEIVARRARELDVPARPTAPNAMVAPTQRYP